jgi:hypothetical protein|nr:MAG TPA: Restriction endonuclease [Caudoviricetes sp.]
MKNLKKKKVLKVVGLWFLCCVVILMPLSLIPGAYSINQQTGQREYADFPMFIATFGGAALTYFIWKKLKARNTQNNFGNQEADTGPSPQPPHVDTLIEIDQMEGHQFEYWCADLLKKLGFENVQVTPGSGDQGVDVLAEKGGVKYAVQCKCYSHDLGNTPIQEVEAGRIFYNCHVGVVITNRYFTRGAKELAQRTGTLLWDRDFIASSIITRT